MDFVSDGSGVSVSKLFFDPTSGFDTPIITSPLRVRRGVGESSSGPNLNLTLVPNLLPTLSLTLNLNHLTVFTAYCSLITAH